MRLIDVDELIEIFKEEIEYQEGHRSFRAEVKGLKYALKLTKQFARDSTNKGESND